jgi:hypothetical protein
MNSDNNKKINKQLFFMFQGRNIREIRAEALCNYCISVLFRVSLHTCNYTQKRRSGACTDKLHNILVTHLSAKIGLNMVGEVVETD